MHDNKKNRRLNELKVIIVTALLTAIKKRSRIRTMKSEHALIHPSMEGAIVDTYSSPEISIRRWIL